MGNGRDINVDETVAYCKHRNLIQQTVGLCDIAPYLEQGMWRGLDGQRVGKDLDGGDGNLFRHLPTLRPETPDNPQS
jgi:hypothetical protein